MTKRAALRKPKHFLDRHKYLKRTLLGILVKSLLGTGLAGYQQAAAAFIVQNITGFAVA